MLDLYFFYKNIGRYILLLKYSYKDNGPFNYIDLIKFSKLAVYFNIKDINDLNNFSVLNYIYFFKYYFSVIPFFSNYNYRFHLNTDYYSFHIQYNFVNKSIYFPMFFFLNDIYYMLNRSFIELKEESNYYDFKVNDMNFFIEKKNSIGFFNLKHSIHFRFYFKNLLNLKLFNLLTIFKLKI
jgi:hypothetical protein